MSSDKKFKVISTEDLRKSYGAKEVLKGVNLSVGGGCVFGLLGANGAGKTTTMNILTGVLAPSSGEVRILDMPMEPDNVALRRRIGVMHDSLGLFEQMTGEEHIVFSASVYGVGRWDISRRMDELLELLDLKAAASSRILEYSSGMRKKVALACAIIHNPEVIFLDEPFEGMDAVSVYAIRNNLRALAERGRTIFLTSHILEIVEKVCDEAVILSDGDIAINVDLNLRQEKKSEQRGGDISHVSLENALLSLSPGDRQKRVLSWAVETSVRDSKS